MKLILNIFFTIILFQNISFANNLFIEKNGENKEKRDFTILLKNLEESKNPEHHFYLGMFYLNGYNEKDDYGNIIKPNLVLAKKFLIKSSEEGYGKASNTLGISYLFNEMLKKEKNSIDKAEFFLLKAYEQKEINVVTSLGDFYINFKPNSYRALYFLNLGDSLNLSTAQFALARIYYEGFDKDTKNIIKKDLEKSSYFLSKACTNKNKTEFIKNMCNSNLIIKENNITKKK